MTKKSTWEICYFIFFWRCCCSSAILVAFARWDLLRQVERWPTFWEQHFFCLSRPPRHIVSGFCCLFLWLLDSLARKRRMQFISKERMNEQSKNELFWHWRQHTHVLNNGIKENQNDCKFLLVEFMTCVSSMMIILFTVVRLALDTWKMYEKCLLYREWKVIRQCQQRKDETKM